MSQRYPGGVITKSPTAPTQSAASGVWTLEQVAEYVKSDTWPVYTPSYVEDVFSTYLYTGTGSSLLINNGIDLSGEGGLVWIKQRNSAIQHELYDTLRGTNKALFTDYTDPSTTVTNGLTAFNADGFSLGSRSIVNGSSNTYASWTFRKTKKFFDVVTYTGDGVQGRSITHNLGSTPGCIIVKRTNTTANWSVYHRGLDASSPQNYNILLNTTNARLLDSGQWNNTAPTSTTFTVGDGSTVNASGSTYIAYLFAHDAGGFGDAGDQSVIKCGSFTASSNLAVTLDWEPQWVLLKRTDSTQNWLLMDNMRGMPVGGSEALLRPNVSDAETATLNIIDPTATGFTVIDGGGLTMGGTYIYIAIRRGPMKTPESGTDVFDVDTTSNDTAAITTNFPVDLSIESALGASQKFFVDRLRGGTATLSSTNTSAEGTGGAWNFASNTSYTPSNFGSGTNVVGWAFRRAPGFFDVVCYTGTGSAGATVSHNLGVAPELIITRVRNYSGEDWIVHYNDGSSITAGYLNSTAAFAGSGSAPSTDLNSFTSTTYNRNTGNRRVNGSYNYVAYLFASCPGVSKIGSVTVSSSGTLDVDCGFTAGARFVMLKGTNITSDWLVFDTARGIVAGNDPYLGLNTTSAENFNGANDCIDPYSPGFSIPMSTFSNLYGTGTFIYLAIA